jgi:hypothetical protein
MNTKNQEVANIASMMVAVITQLRTDGAPEPIQLAYAKTVMMDQEQVNTRDRQPVLQLVNNQLGTKWSFNQIKKAENFVQNNEPIKVQELNGTAQVNVSGQPAEATFVEKAPQVDGHVHLQQTNNAETTAPDQAGQTSSINSTANEQENDTMNAQVNATSNIAENVKAFALAMSLVGRNTAEQRAEAWTAFIATSPEQAALWALFSATADATKSFDENFVTFSEGLGEEEGKTLVTNFMRWSAANQPKGDAHYSDKSRYSLMGDRDEGIRTSWIAVGSAVIGGGMEAFARGGLNVGSAVGTVVGGVAAFFAGEQVDQHVESQFGRYVVGGMIGLGLGGAGAALGRSVLPGNPLLEMNNNVAAAPARIEAQPTAPQGSLGFFGM